MKLIYFFAFVFISGTLLAQEKASDPASISSEWKSNDPSLQILSSEMDMLKERLETQIMAIDHTNDLVEKHLLIMGIAVAFITLFLSIVIVWNEYKNERVSKKVNAALDRLVASEEKNQAIRRKSNIVLFEPDLSVKPASDADHNLVQHIIREPDFGKVVSVLSGNTGNPALKYCDVVIFNAFNVAESDADAIQVLLTTIYNNLIQGQGLILCAAHKSKIKLEGIERPEIWTQFSNNICTVYPNVMNLLKVKDLLRNF